MKLKVAVTYIFRFPTASSTIPYTSYRLYQKPAMVFKSNYPDVELPRTGIVQYIFSNPYGTPDNKPILIDDIAGKSITFGELRSLVKRFAASLKDKFNFKHSEVLCLFSSNVVDYSVPLFGTIAAGGIVSPANPAYNEKELAYQLQEANATILISSPDSLDIAVKAAKAAGIPKDRILLFGDKTVGGFKPYSSILSKREANPVEYTFEGAKTTTAYLCFSSGTTGRSKGVVTTHLNIGSNVAQIDAFESHHVNKKADKYMGVLPFYHIYGLNLLIHVTLFWGCTLYVMPKFDLVQFCEIVQRNRVTHAYIVPPIALLLTKSPIVEKYDFSSMKIFWSGAAPLSAELSQAFIARIKAPIKQAYGMTESSPASHIVPMDNIVHGSVGLLLPSMLAKIVDENGKELGINEPGELWMKGPNVMKGYLNNPKATAETLDADGFLHTGDIAYVDSDGFYYIVDRLKELIKYKGFQVPPAELEAVLISSPLVADSSVIGMWDDDQATELPRAYVVLTPGVPATRKTAYEIQKFVDGKVAQHKKLRGGVKFIDAIPKSASGKILRRFLRDEAMKQSKAEKAKSKL